MATLRRTALLLGAAVLAGGAAKRADDVPDAPQLAPPGITAIAGQVVDLQGHGLPGVELVVGSSRVVTGADGRYLLTYVIAGKSVLQIDGTHAGPKRDTDHGFYEVRVETPAGKTTVLPYRNWLPRIDHAHDVQIPSPTTSEVVLTTPAIPGFEVRIPPGVVIRDVDGHVVTRIGVTAIPADRMPFPLPPRVDVPTSFTIQPGAACLYDAQGGVAGAQLVYPNFHNDLPRARAMLWRYEPDANGWTSYGIGTVSADGRQIVPDADAVVTDFGSAECEPGTRTRQPPPERVMVPHPEKAPAGGAKK